MQATIGTKFVSDRERKKNDFHSLQPRQREGQGQAKPEGVRGGPEVKDEAIARPVVWTRGHDPEKEHHREETAQTDRQIKQCGG